MEIIVPSIGLSMSELMYGPLDKEGNLKDVDDTDTLRDEEENSKSLFKIS
jgi:hypothetical protein